MAEEKDLQAPMGVSNETTVFFKLTLWSGFRRGRLMQEYVARHNSRMRVLLTVWTLQFGNGEYDQQHMKNMKG